MKTKTLAINKVYTATTKLLDKGIEITIVKVAKAAKCANETARVSLIKLVDLKALIRNKKTGKIINYK